MAVKNLIRLMSLNLLINLVMIGLIVFLAT